MPRGRIPLGIIIVGVLLAALIGALSGIYSRSIYGGLFGPLKSVVLLIAGIFSFTVSYGLWKGARWGWLLGFGVSIISIFTLLTFNIIGFAIGAIITYYLSSKNTRSYFKVSSAQSAMEYLMTYGWAILIIAVVLGALFSLGVFNGSASLGNACVAVSGFLCQNLTYSHSSGGIIVTLGQSTGSSWTSANFLLVPTGAAITGGVPLHLSSQAIITASGNTPGSTGGFSAPGLTSGNALVSGQTATMWLPVNGIATNVATCTSTSTCPSVGATASGTIWAQYTVGALSSNPPVQYVELATINIRAS